jgi:hypothetical protein
MKTSLSLRQYNLLKRYPTTNDVMILEDKS